jgi:hypothetical protein
VVSTEQAASVAWRFPTVRELPLTLLATERDPFMDEPVASAHGERVGPNGEYEAERRTRHVPGGFRAVSSDDSRFQPHATGRNG